MRPTRWRRSTHVAVGVAVLLLVAVVVGVAAVITTGNSASDAQAVKPAPAAATAAPGIVPVTDSAIKPMPDRLLKQLKAARTFNQGFQTVEYTASALLDMELHTVGEAEGLDIDTFEKNVLSRIGMPTEIVPRHRVPHFQHIIGGYAAGYYSYLWSEVMDADAFAAFEEAGDIFDRKTATKLKTHIYSAGGKRDALDAYVAFRGSAPETDGLLRKRGLV